MTYRIRYSYKDSVGTHYSERTYKANYPDEAILKFWEDMAMVETVRIVSIWLKLSIHVRYSCRR